MVGYWSIMEIAMENAMTQTQAENDWQTYMCVYKVTLATEVKSRMF